MREASICSKKGAEKNISAKSVRKVTEVRIKQQQISTGLYSFAKSISFRALCESSEGSVTSDLLCTVIVSVHRGLENLKSPRIEAKFLIPRIEE